MLKFAHDLRPLKVNLVHDVYGFYLESPFTLQNAVENILLILTLPLIEED